MNGLCPHLKWQLFPKFSPFPYFPQQLKIILKGFGHFLLPPANHNLYKMFITFKLNMKSHPTFITPPSVSDRYYCLEEKIGEGAFGIVYKAYDLSHPEVPVAVKKPKEDIGRVNIISCAQSRTMREAGFLQLIRDPHVVRYIDHGSESGFPYVVMEYVPETLARVRVNQDVIENYIEQISVVLKVLQESNVAHCDLKAGNIGYVSEKLKLLDFGLAAPFEHNFFHFHLPVQSHHPPEFRRAQVVTRTTDMYSAGKILEQLVVGKYNLPASAAIEKMKQKYSAAPPKSFQHLLRSMLRQQPFRRPNPSQLLELANDALQDLRHKKYFSSFAAVPLTDAQIHFFGGASSSS